MVCKPQLQFSHVSIMVIVPLSPMGQGPCPSSWASKEASTGLLEQDRKFVYPRFLVHPALTHQICCNCMFILHLALVSLKCKIFGAEATWTHLGRILILLPIDISQETHMKSRGNNLFHIYLP